MNIKSVLAALLANTAFAVVTGAFIYLIDNPLPGFSQMGTALLVAGTTFVAMPVNMLGLALLDELLNRREAKRLR